MERIESQEHQPDPKEQEEMLENAVMAFLNDRTSDRVYKKILKKNGTAWKIAIQALLGRPS
jgi:hypothetical protein